MNLRLYVNYYLEINGFTLNFGSIITHFLHKNSRIQLLPTAANVQCIKVFVNYFKRNLPLTATPPARACELRMSSWWQPCVRFSRSQFETANRQQAILLTREIPWSAAFRGVVNILNGLGYLVSRWSHVRVCFCSRLLFTYVASIS